jgi:hypothetical protein
MLPVRLPGYYQGIFLQVYPANLYCQLSAYILQVHITWLFYQDILQGLYRRSILQVIILVLYQLVRRSGEETKYIQRYMSLSKLK